MADCIEMLRPRFDKAGVAIASELGPDALKVSGFPVQFKRAVLNIMANAEQFAPRPGRLSIRSFSRRSDAVFEFADDGPGIPKGERAKIFDLFYSRRPGGTGLGLALARTAVENCGGTIRAETPPSGRGALIAIRIPLAKA